MTSWTELETSRLRALLAILAALLLATPVSAVVLGVEVERRVVLLDGREFGERGAYELIEGVVHFGFDPANAANQRLTDIGLAPLGADGRVHARADLVVLQAVDPDMRRGTAIVEVVNRGRRLALGSINRAAFDFRGDATLDPARAADFGDGLAMEEGITLVSIGWQYDVPDFPGAMRLQTPRAQNEDGSPVRGMARSDWVVEKPAERLALAAMGHLPHAAAEPAAAENRLTVRSAREADRELVPRASWHFDETRTGIRLDGGFAAGKIYELVYVAHDPPLVGLGFASFRDIISYMRFDPQSLFPVERGIAIGSSQSGRFLRHFLYDAFNVDEAGRQAYQGVVINVAGAGRGGFNHRFGHPGRVGNPFRNFFYPGDDFPFASVPTRESATREPAGVFDRSIANASLPLLFQVNTGYEYWGRVASLIQMSSDGERDLVPPDNERIYHLASAPHYPQPFPPAAAQEVAPGVYRGSSLDSSSITRALIFHMLAWVEEGQAPPASHLPRIDVGTLVPPRDVRIPVPGLATPRTAHVAYRLDFGPRFASQGIIDHQPPARGAAYAVRVPQLDAQGIELGGIRALALRVPIGSYLPWALRTGYAFAEEEMTDFLGTFAPFARTDAAREAAADTRPSFESLYPTRAAYDSEVEVALDSMIAEGWMLARDRERERENAHARWDWMQRRNDR